MKKIFVSGHSGMVGSAICRNLSNKGIEVITSPRSELDLTNQHQVKEYFNDNKFDQVYLAAAKVGGIYANNEYPADFIFQNIMIQSNIIHESYKSGVKKLIFLGSSCIYPKLAKQPITESELLNGHLEPTNEPYAIAKIAGIKMCESFNRQFGLDYRCLMPTNLYGPGDNFHPENSHVLPSLINKFHAAKINNNKFVEVWGSGNPKREFLHVDDMASASVFLMSLDKSEYSAKIKPMQSHVNIGSGSDISIKDLAYHIRDIIGFDGDIVFDDSKPDGTPRKLMDVKLLRSLGWVAKIEINEGIKNTYSWFLNNQKRLRNV
jgi:GDP-L-fucose synthase